MHQSKLIDFFLKLQKPLGLAIEQECFENTRHDDSVEA